MTNNLRVGILIAAATLTFSSNGAFAQTKCYAGRTADGQCANAGLVAVARQISVIFSQPKISQTAYAVMPSSDRAFRYPNQLNPDQLRATPIGRIPPSND